MAFFNMAVSTRQDSQLGSFSNPLAAQIAALTEQAEREPYSDWYLGHPNHRSTDPAKEAYESAIEILQNELTIDEYEAIRLRQHNSMQKVQDAVTDALEEYETKSKGSKVRSWLASCSSRVMYYGAIFDTFSQHHPEYVSLAWGAMKFLFIAVINHEELLTEISKAISKMADVLPRTKLHSILYPTPRMRDVVSQLYAKIIEFFMMSIKWYKKGKLIHSITAITKPFSLSFKPIIAEVMELSRRVDELANAASKAEIRDLNIQMHGLHKTVAHLTEILTVQQQQQVLNNQSLFALQEEYKQMFRRRQIEEIQDIMTSKDTPSSDDSLAYCRSMRNRRRQKMPTQLPALALDKLRSWILDPSSSLLLAQGKGVRTSSLDFAADFLDTVIERGYPVLWALPPITERNSPEYPSVLGILRSLVSQVLELNPKIVSEGSHPITIKHFKSANNVYQWFDILERCVSLFSQLFMVIDMGLIEMAVGHGKDEHSEAFLTADFIDRMTELVARRRKGGLKIVVISWRFGTATSLDASKIFDNMQIFTDMGRKNERLMRQPKYRVMYRTRNQRFAERFRDTIRATGS